MVRNRINIRQLLNKPIKCNNTTEIKWFNKLLSIKVASSRTLSNVLIIFKIVATVLNQSWLYKITHVYNKLLILHNLYELEKQTTIKHCRQLFLSNECNPCSEG